MEDFVQKYSEKILKFKRSVLQPKQIREFVVKLTKKTEEDARKELTKLLFPKNKYLSESAISERDELIILFLKELDQLKHKNQETKKTKINQEWKPKLQINDEDFPTLSSSELVKRKKNFVVLDRHYQNRLEPGIKECFCM